jgi:hypothetical protein
LLSLDSTSIVETPEDKIEGETRKGPVSCSLLINGRYGPGTQPAATINVPFGVTSLFISSFKERASQSMRKDLARGENAKDARSNKQNQESNRI